MKTKHITQRSIIFLFVLLLSGSQINAQTIFAGSDGLVTDSNGTFVFLPIPANFFGPGSDPFSGTVIFKGAPLATLPPNALDPAETVVRRLNDALLPTCGSSDVVPIEIVALHLVSCQPIIVTYSGGMNPEPWNIEVGLSGQAPQPQGSMTVTKAHTNGGTWDSYLPVRPQFIFSRFGPPATVTLDPGPIIQFNSSNSPWVYGCPSCSGYMIPPGVLVDNDLNGSYNASVPPSTNFYPGISSNGDCINPGGTYSNGPIVEQAPSQGAQHTVNSPVNASSSIPTLSQWGLIILGLLFAAGGFIFMRKNA